MSSKQKAIQAVSLLADETERWKQRAVSAEQATNAAMERLHFMETRRAEPIARAFVGCMEPQIEDVAQFRQYRIAVMPRAPHLVFPYLDLAEARDPMWVVNGHIDKVVDMVRDDLRGRLQTIAFEMSKSSRGRRY